MLDFNNHLITYPVSLDTMKFVHEYDEEFKFIFIQDHFNTDVVYESFIPANQYLLLTGMKEYDYFRLYLTICNKLLTIIGLKNISNNLMLPLFYDFNSFGDEFTGVPYFNNRSINLLLELNGSEIDVINYFSSSIYPIYSMWIKDESFEIEMNRIKANKTIESQNYLCPLFLDILLFDIYFNMINFSLMENKHNSIRKLIMDPDYIDEMIYQNFTRFKHLTTLPPSLELFSTKSNDIQYEHISHVTEMTRFKNEEYGSRSTIRIIKEIFVSPIEYFDVKISKGNIEIISLVFCKSIYDNFKTSIELNRFISFILNKLFIPLINSIGFGNELVRLVGNPFEIHLFKNNRLFIIPAMLHSLLSIPLNFSEKDI